ncbi:alpha-1,4-glucan--maltose-1-phosphate maltosyltransferase [Catenuloplanes japonicus]|uniref:alpha-1,4-glucan--maltose-1-phosphate maltosyltransferase n=1 Tax=Catenuloplanes japonicus TaxID=33876 RepID=UPI0005570B33|nr:alpha-1,4-glucan--maltose-1-phosphate maltosyltransferase [Catenuloplanes japonicus]
MTGRFPIEEVGPTVDAGRYPAKAVVGELLPVTVTAYREGHHALGVNVVWQGPDGDDRAFTRMRPLGLGLDRWEALIRPDAPGAWTFRIEAFDDPYLTWHGAVTKKLEAGQGIADLANDLAEGAALLAEAARRLPLNAESRAGIQLTDKGYRYGQGSVIESAAEIPEDAVPTPRAERARIFAAAEALRDEELSLEQRTTPALQLEDLLWEKPVRRLVTSSESYPLWVDRRKAVFSSWYEFFPRSEGAVLPHQSGTFQTAIKRLPAVAEMGFDVLYLPPIHPIGRIHRKGRNNSLIARAEDVGSPWAIGAEEGGHDAIHPDLGTVEDFREFVRQANELGVEVALDLALQCAPDHPWVTEHPEWFTTRADGTIAYAENPPKKYQDIYPLNFDNDPEGIRAEMLRIVRHWMGEGIRAFRVDNPHTKPLDFWYWLIGEIKKTDPDVIFLAEAFTRPAVMHGLAKIGFTQSYSYFTWRNSAEEMREYCEELVAAAHYMTPNFWPNTPDILHEALQHGGPPIFKIRAVLASMLSPSWGMYTGYELFEHEPRPGVEEYLDNEKFELRPRDWELAEVEGRSLKRYLTTLNSIRKRNPALHWLRNLRFHHCDNPAILVWSKKDPESANTILVACSFDPNAVQWATVDLEMPSLGLGWDDRVRLHDQLSGANHVWGASGNAVRLDPAINPAHIFTVERIGG